MLWQKGRRDLLEARWQVLGLAVLVAIVVALLAGGWRAQALLTTARSETRARLHAADLDVRCSPTGKHKLDAVADLPGIATREARMLLDGMMTLPRGAPLPTSFRILPPDLRPKLFALDVREGRWPRSDEEALLVDRSTAAARGIRPGDEVQVEILGTKRTLPVTGICLGSEHLLHPMHPDLELPVTGALGVAHVSPAAAKHFRYADRVDSLLFRFEEGVDPDVMQRAILDRLSVAVMGVVTPKTEPGTRGSAGMLKIYAISMPTVVSVLVVVVLVLFVITIVRLVHARRRQIGTLLALGVRPLPVTLSLLLLSVVPTIVGWVVGILVHPVIASVIVTQHEERLGWPPRADLGPGPEVLWTLVGCVAIALGACALPALAATRRLPGRLLRPRARRNPGSHKLTGPLRRKLRDALRLPLSVLLGFTAMARRRWSTIAAVVALAANFAVVLALLFVQVSHAREIRSTVDALGLDGAAYFHEPQLESDVRAEASPSWTTLEPMITRIAWMDFPSGPAFARVICAEPDGWMRTFPIAEGAAFGGDPRGIHIDYWLADEYGLSIGDRITCYPFFSAPEGTPVEVVGILGGVTLGIAVMPLEDGRAAFDLPAMATNVQVASAAPRDDVLRTLQALPGATSVFYLRDVRGEVVNTMAASRFIIALVLMLSVIVAVVFLGLLAALDASERARDLAVLRALGWRRRSVTALCVTEVSTRGYLGLLLALPAAPLLATWILDRIREANHYQVALHRPWGLYAAVVGAALVLIPLGALPALRAAAKLSPQRVVRMLTSE